MGGWVTSLRFLGFLSIACCASTKELKKLWLFIGSNGVKTIAKKKTIESIKQERLNSLQENDDVEGQGLNKTANSVNNSQYV